MKSFRGYKAQPASYSSATVDVVTENLLHRAKSESVQSAYRQADQFIDWLGEGPRFAMVARLKPDLEIKTGEVTGLINQRISSPDYYVTGENLNKLLFNSRIFSGIIRYDAPTKTFSSTKKMLETALNRLRGNSLEMTVRKQVFGEKFSSPGSIGDGSGYEGKSWHDATAEQLRQAKEEILRLEKRYKEGKISSVRKEFPGAMKKWKMTKHRWLPLAETTDLEPKLYEIDSHYRTLEQELKESKDKAK
jgi:hypothetical protein